MEQEGSSLSEISKYQLLHERGVKLPDKEIDFIVSQLELGSRDALKFLDREHDQYPWPRLIASDNLDRNGYVPEQKVINIPVPYMNELAATPTSLATRTERLYTIHPTGLQKSVPYNYSLRLGGREETIHHYQNVGHPLLKAQNIITEGSEHIPPEDKILCDIEVEARKIVDQICLAHGEDPIWKPFDDYLQRARPEAYNQPVTYFLGKK